MKLQDCYKSSYMKTKSIFSSSHHTYIKKMPLNELSEFEKEHFISNLAATNPQFPMHLLCRIIDQATTTLNLLRPSCINPRLSAEAHLNGAFDYNTTPFAPPGS